jgi:hypothetical protein
MMEQNNNQQQLKASRVIRYKTRLALSIIWLCAIIVCILLVAFSSANTNGIAANFNIADAAKHLHTSTTVNARDAFVFVNIDKKFILTRFPAAALPVPALQKTTANTAAIKETVQKPIRITVISKVKNKPVKNTGEFSIGPVPQ